MRAGPRWWSSPETARKTTEHRLPSQTGLFIYTYEGSSVQLGKACGKPFMVSALAIVDPGESDLLSLKRA